MDHESFDDLVRLLSTPGSRRAALAALLGLGGVGAAETAIAAKSRNRGTGRKGRAAHGRRRRGDDRLQAEAACYPGSPCIPGPGKNLGKCNFADSPALKNKNLTGANLGSATVARGDASGVNFQAANLDKLCLVDTNLTGARLTGATNSATAIFCRTTMPDGTENNAGCNKGTPCCPTCDANHPCDAGEVCCNGRCRSGECCDDNDCPGTVCCARQCCDTGQVCNTDRNPAICCSPGGTCAPGFCGSVPDGCGGRRECPCGTDLTCCAETCKNLQTDPANCGECGRTCGPCQTCRNGQCTGGCASWQTCGANGTCTPTCAERCTNTNCSGCFGLSGGRVVCGAGAITTGGCDDQFRCNSDADCTGPVAGDVCLVSFTTRSDNVTQPQCPDGRGKCATILACS